MQQIILASGSKQRKLLMDSLGIDYKVIPSNIDEKAIRDEDLSLRAEKIARAKAEEVAKQQQGVVISADTFIGFNGEVFEKPENIEQAKQMLAKLSGNTATVYTGFCFLDSVNDVNFSTTSINEISFRNLSEQEIESYVNNFPVMSWSGGFSPAYTYGLTLISKVIGSPTAFTHGLPMDLLIPFLEKSDVKISPK